MFCENEKSIHPTTHTCVSHSKPNMSQAADGYGEHGIAATPKNRSDGRTNASSFMNGVDIQSESTSSGKTVIPLSKSTSLKTFTDRHAIPKNLFTASYKNLASQIEEDAPFSVKMNKCNAIDVNKTSNDSNANDKDSKNINAKKIAVAPALSAVQSSTASASASTPTTQSTSATPLISSRVQSAGSGNSSGGTGRVRYKKNDSESSSGSDVIDLTTSSSKKNVPVSDMYNDDIDYMNNYLKSLPDYNELNRKISNEQQKCEDIYDRLLCINSSLKSNLLPKSNSYHSICTASTKPYQSISARGENNSSNNNKNSSVATKNKIIRSSSSSIVNQNLINNPDKFGAHPIAESKQSIAMIKTGHNQAINTKTVAKAQQKQPQQQPPDTNKDFNEMYKFRNPLPKSASSTNLHRSNSIKELNDFWSENLAKSNQQKLGWNYSRIMANRGDNTNASPNPQPSPNPNGNANTNMGTSGPNASNVSVNNGNDRAVTKLNSNKNDNYAPLSGYKLQKNMSLSQLDQKIRQNVSREELYNLICNNEPAQQQQQQHKPAESTKHFNQMSGNKNNINYNNNLHRTAADSTIAHKSKPNQTAHHTHSKPQNAHQTMQCTSTASGQTNPLSKSFSQQSMPSFFTHFTKMKSPKKNSIPTLFKPLCKSSSNTHVFNNQTRDAPPETFTPKFLMKSSSSSSIFNSNGLLQKICPLNKISSSFGNAKNANNSLSGYVPPTSIAPVTFNNHHHHNHHHNKISKNNELLKTQNKNLLHEMAAAAAKTGTTATSTSAASGCSASLPQSTANKQNSDSFYVKQNFPEFCKATVSYTSTKSNVHAPAYGNVPSIPPLSNPTPATGSIINKPNTNSR